jgi:hypothetical protein
MWHEYPIQSNFDVQKRIVRNLRELIEKTEADGLITGYCFDHYFPTPSELRVRLQYTDEGNQAEVESRLEAHVRAAIPNFVLTQQEWGNDTTDRHILQAYEFGARCAFLSFKLIENGRFSPAYFENSMDFNSVAFQFQTHFNHGVMNSLGICKSPNELFVHILNIMDNTKTKSKTELIEWLQRNMPELTLM